MSETTTPERRRAPRLPTQYKTEIVVLTGQHAGEELQGEVVDVSKEGLGLVMPSGFSNGDQLGFVIYVDGFESLCVGHVVWKKMLDNSARYGLKISRWSYLDPTLGNQLNAAPIS